MFCAVNISDNFDIQSFCRIPYVEAESASHPLSILRETLQSNGNLRQAQALLNIEVALLDSPSAKKEACESLLKSCLDSRDVEVSWLVEGLVRLELAELLNREGNTDVARHEFQNSRSTFERAPVKVSQTNLHQHIKVLELKSSQFTSAAAGFKAWTELCDEVSNSIDASVSTSATKKASEAAFQIFKLEPTDENRKVFWRWQSQAEKLLENAGDLYFLFLGHVTNGVVAFQATSNSGAILQWLQEFEAKHPDFDLWDLRLLAKRNLQVIYARLDDQHNTNVFHNVDEINDIVRRKEAFWKETQSTQDTPDSSNINGTGEQTSNLPVLEANKVNAAWFSEWANELAIAGYGVEQGIEIGTKTVRSTRVTFQILLRWIREAVAKAQLSREELETILADEEPWDETVDVYKVLDQLTAEGLSSQLLGPIEVPKSCDRWSKLFTVLSNWLMKSEDFHPLKKQFLLLRLQFQRQNRIIASGCPAKDKIIETQRLLDLESTVDAEARIIGGDNTTQWRNIVCVLKNVIYAEEHGNVLLDEESPEFREILELYRISLKDEQQKGNLRTEADIWMLIAEHCYFAAQRLRPGALAIFQDALQNAEITYQKIREGWKNLRGWKKVEKVLSAVQEERRLRIHPMAMGVVRQIPDTHREMRNAMLWSTVQGAKSIGLGWLMRTNQTNDSGRFSPDSMARYSDFEKFPTITTEDVQAITDDVGGDVVYVDWYRGSININQMPSPVIVTLSPGQQLQASFVKMSWEDIDRILEKWLKYNASDLLDKEACSILQQLHPLIEPLREVSKPGQVLVFSATGDLHRIPLHAIALDGEILIRRNPIVYTSSLTVLDVLFKARTKHEHSRSPSSNQPPFKAALFGEPPLKQGKRALSTLRKDLSAPSPAPDTFTTKHFVRAMQDPELELLHYHSHADFADTDPTAQRLLFDDTSLSLPDLFSLSPPTSPFHVALLACGSGMTKTSAVSGEVIGLVPAFLYAGAGSTVSALWPFDDRDAALYTRYFYERIVKAKGAGRGSGERVDLAKANQEAVLRIMDEKPSVYHWAPFVLNGFWMMRVSGQEE